MQQQLIQISSMTPEQFHSMLGQVVRTELAEFIIAQPQQAPLPEFITRAETARLLRISLVTLHKLTNQGTLQSLRIEGQVRYRREDVLTCLKEDKNEQTKR